MHSGGIGPSVREAFDLLRLIWFHPENRRHRIKALSRFFAWQVWERTVASPWTVHLTGDRIIRCYPHSAGASGVLYCRLLEWAEAHFVLDYLQPGDLFVDVGANVGVYTLLASTRPAVRVMAFEPSSVAYQRLSENVQLNGLKHVEVFNLALGSRPGNAHLTTDRDTTNHLTPGPSRRTEPITLRALDSYFEDPGTSQLALVKVDVEGEEIAVLEGALRLLRSQAPALIVERNRPDELRDLLGGLGYEFFRYHPGSRELEPIEVSEPETNLIAIRDRASAQRRLATGKPQALA